MVKLGIFTKRIIFYSVRCLHSEISQFDELAITKIAGIGKFVISLNWYSLIHICMRFLYNILIYLFRFALLLASIFSDKAGKWIGGRKNIFKKLKNSILPNDEYIWIHCASLGEFEQGRPIIEGLKKSHESLKILLTFFSPSGFEIRKNYEYADVITYLPLDTIRNANKFIKIAKPKFVVFVKYEFWYNYLYALKKQNIPVVFISSIFRADQYFFKSYAGWFREQLAATNHFFVQNEESKNLLHKIGIRQVTACGDTRFDRVYELAKSPKKIGMVEFFKGNKQLIVAGSTWLPDEELVIPMIEKFPQLKFVIAPHEIHHARVQQILEKIGSQAVLLSAADAKNIANYKVLIVDSIGILAHLYQYAKIAYIGGGFKTGLHNIQEPVTFGIPVIFGPKYNKFQEAVELIKLKGAFSIKSVAELEVTLSKLVNNKELYQNARQTNKNYVSQSIGASKIILDYLNRFLKN